MRNRHSGRILSSCAAATVVIGLSPTTAVAATPAWTINPGGDFTASTHSVVLLDTVTGFPIICKASPGSKAAGHLKGGSGLPNDIGTVDTMAFNSCASADFTYTLKASALPWTIHALTYDSSTGTTDGTITGIHALLNFTNLSCTATIDGTGASQDNGEVRFQHVNSAPTELKILKGSDNLHIYNVQGGCLGVIADGNPLAIYHVPASGGVTYTLDKGQDITSP